MSKAISCREFQQAIHACDKGDEIDQQQMAAGGSEKGVDSRGKGVKSAFGF
jgi:hypothetical protein